MEELLIGTTDRTILVFIPDPASTTGAGKTGLVAASITVTYTRVETDNDCVNSDVTSSMNDLSALTDPHNDWGWKEVSNTLCKGLYRLDLADAVFATGAWYAVVQVTITSGTAAATPKAFKLVNLDMFGTPATNLATAGTNYSATRGLTGTAVPAADADAAGGLPISDAGGLDLDARLDAAVSSRMATYTQPTGFLTATFPAGTIANTTNITAGTITTVTNVTNAPTSGDFTSTMKTSIGTAVAASAVASVTGNVGGNVAGSVGSVTGLTASDVGAIKAKTDNLPSDPADESLVIAATDAIMGRLGAPAGASVSADVAAVKSDTAGIKAKTDSLTFTTAGFVDSNVGYVNDVEVNGTGTGIDPWGP